ncbi:DNA adenine methylase [Flammeovirga sp. OC4]|uniref:DNA adenine methylase n=1 Tax=Flammeovirga sp. OC4 TaxID=1382345 RepID=UPI0005C766F7|nr:DNA adenine methylase [Flammeovirga sp. OC4]
MKTPITYYGGKQKLASKIVSMIPGHTLYCEPFFGGGAVFFEKSKSGVEVINDTNREMMNFYKIVQQDFTSLEKEIQISLHSRDMYRKASVIYNNPDMFSELKRAWAVWVLSSQGFASKIDGSWGYDKKRNTTSKKVMNKRDGFTLDYAIRLQDVQIECTDALRIITSRDTQESFFYLDPPYFNSNCGHYDGYTIEDFEMLLKRLENVEGKFLLSSYPSDVLESFRKRNGWHQLKVEQEVTVNNKSGKRKKKIEVLTANYPIQWQEQEKKSMSSSSLKNKK